jgi:hypothetical protein
MIWVVVRAAAAAASAILTIAANWDYLREVRRRDAHPRLASWSIWAAAMAVGAIGAAQDGQWPAAVLGAAGSATCLSVLVSGWRHGDRTLGWLDGAACVTGGAGIVLLTEAIMWPDRIPMSTAIGISVVTDLAAFVPTYHNAVHGDEVARPYLVFMAGAAIALAAADFTQPTGIIYPAYETAACALAAGLATWAARRRPAADPAAVAEILAATWRPAPVPAWHQPAGDGWHYLETGGTRPSGTCGHDRSLEVAHE